MLALISVSVPSSDPGFESLQERRVNFFLQGQLPVLTLISVSFPDRRLVTAVHDVCGFAWSDMVHGCMVYTERAETAAVSGGTSHVSTPLRWIFRNAL